MPWKKKKDDDFIEIDEDPYKKKRDKKEKEIFEKENSDYPVLGDDKDSFIVDTKKQSLFSKISVPSRKKIFSKFNPIEAIENKVLPFKKNTKDSVDESEIVEDKEEKFFMAPEDEETQEDDGFILDDFEGVYTRNHRDWKKIKTFLMKAGIILLFSLIIFGFGFLTSRLITTDESGPCPYECCFEEDNFEDRLCPGLSNCIDNVCVKPNCPDDFECCPGTIYAELPCEDPYKTCDSHFVCVQKECPYECCTASDGYKIKECINDGNCINNICYLDPCPYECCIDEIDYNNKKCESGKVCVDNDCVPNSFYILIKIIDYFRLVSRLII